MFPKDYDDEVFEYVLDLLREPPAGSDLKLFDHSALDAWITDLRPFYTLAEAKEIIKKEKYPRSSSSNAKEDIMRDMFEGVQAKIKEYS